jgi:hypothetical protein
MCFFRELTKMEKNMKVFKYLLPFAMATCGFTVAVNAQEPRDYATVQESRERDSDAVNEFVKSKRAITVQEKGGNLMISGDLRGEWSHLQAKSNMVKDQTKKEGKYEVKGKNGKTEHKNNKRKMRRQRGSGTNHFKPAGNNFAPYATNEFTTEDNLMFDYKADRTWAAIQLKMSNDAGIRSTKIEEGKNKNKNVLFGSGTLDGLVLRKAYMGYNIVEEGTCRFDVEIGRRRFFDVFDSKIQFDNYYDGLLLKYSNSFEGATDFVGKISAFVVDNTVNHFGYIGELGCLNIMACGLDLKYSLIDWDTVPTNRLGSKHPRGAKFLNSQYTLAYNVSPDMLGAKTKVYGAFLNNARAKHKGNAWYAGAKVGDVKKMNDWSVDVNYQWVQPYSIPESDVAGIGRDNPRNISIYVDKAGGFANYKGFQVDSLYALTDNWTMNMKVDQVRQQTRRVGGKHHSWQFQLAAIYAF